MEYIITITETLQREVPVEASSKGEALKKVKEDYSSERIVLSDNDFTNVEFN